MSLDNRTWFQKVLKMEFQLHLAILPYLLHLELLRKTPGLLHCRQCSPALL